MMMVNVTYLQNNMNSSFAKMMYGEKSCLRNICQSTISSECCPSLYTMKSKMSNE